MPDPILSNPAPTPAPTPTPAPAAITLPELPGEWHTALPDDLKGEESIKLIKDIPSLARSYVSAQKLVGADKVAIPNPKYATDEDYQKVYQKLGLPAKFEEYNVDAPKDLQLEEERLKAFKEAAYKVGILPKQLQSLLQWHEADTKKVLSAAKEKMDQQVATAKEDLKKEWGEAHDKKLAQAKLVLKTVNDPKLVEFLETSGMGNHPQLIKVFAKLGEMLTEKQVQGLGDETGKFGGVKTPEEARREIAKIQGDLTHPYHDAKHHAHKQAVADMSALFGQAYPHEEARVI